MSEKINPTCRKCNGECKESKAFHSKGWISVSDEHNLIEQCEPCTIADNGVKNCYKCSNCGHSFTVGKDAEFDEFCRLNDELTKMLGISESAKRKQAAGETLRFSERNANFIANQILKKLCDIIGASLSLEAYLHLTQNFATANRKSQEFDFIKQKFSSIIRPADLDQQ